MRRPDKKASCRNVDQQRDVLGHYVHCKVEALEACKMNAATTLPPIASRFDSISAPLCTGRMESGAPGRVPGTLQVRLCHRDDIM